MFLLVHLIGLRTAVHADQLSPAAKQSESTACGGGGGRVTHFQYERAQSLIQRGYSLHQEMRFDDAAKAYSEALSYWNHPEIRLSLGWVLFYSARLLESYNHLSMVIPCMGELTDADDKRQALALWRRLQRRLSAIEVRSTDPSVEVFFNGSPWYPGISPTLRDRPVYPGQYLVTIRKPNHISQSNPIVVMPGQRAVVTPRLWTVEEATLTEHRWTPWKVKAIATTGLGLLALSAGLHVVADHEMGRFDRKLEARCPMVCGSDSYHDISGIEFRAKWANRIAIGALITGSVATVSGVSLMLMNRPVLREDSASRHATVSVVPLLSPTMAGIHTSISY